MKGKPSIFLLSALIAVFLGVFAASGIFTFVSAHGTSYLSNDPAVCVNCHIMQEQYDGWVHGSHHAVAACNDCHLPHDNLVHKLLVKASNGYHHSKAFTLMGFQEPIRIKPGNAEVLEANCIRCHEAMVNETTPVRARWPCAICNPAPAAGNRKP